MMEEPAKMESPEMEGTITCPHCGQRLASTCRVCVSCKQAIDPTALKPVPPPAPAVTAVAPEPPRPVARFSWPIFFLTLGAFWVASALVMKFVALATAQLIMFGVVVGSSFWVLWDAQTRRIPKPWRWGAGCILFWIIFFPWYLARRRTPEAECPSVEGGRGALLRLLLVALFLLLLGALIALVKGPPAAS